MPSVPGLAAAAVRPGLVDVLVDARELEMAQSIAAEWGVGAVPDPGDS